MGAKGREGGSPPVLRISAGEGDAVHWVMTAKEEPSRRIMGNITARNGGGGGCPQGPPGASAHILTSFDCLSV